MKLIPLAIALALLIASAAYCGDDYEDGSGSGDESSAHTNTTSGGILAKNNVAPYRSIPKNSEEDACAMDNVLSSEKSSGKTGQELMTTDRQRRDREQADMQEAQDYQRAPLIAPINSKIKAKVKNKYDDEGNLIKETPNR